MWQKLALFGLAWLAAAAPALRVTKVARVEQRLMGGVLVDTTALFTWGKELRLWNLRNLTSQLLATGDFRGGGCAVDLNGDGSFEFVSKEGPGLGRLVWRSAPTWNAVLIDTDIEMPDCLGATLFGRRGILTIHRFQQVRFYEKPMKTGQPWPYREIYAIYTPSEQAGLAVRDVDDDGLPDIFCGNYWIKSPAAFDLPWRLFAINTYSEEKTSARLRVVPIGTGEVVAQIARNPGRITWFERPDQPSHIWIDHRLSDEARNVGGLAVADLDADGQPEVIAGERDGQRSQLLVFRNAGQYHFDSIKVSAQDEFLGLWSLGAGALVSVHPHHVELWGPPRR